jgi:hypothetical protein
VSALSRYASGVLSWVEGGYFEVYGDTEAGNNDLTA